MNTELQELQRYGRNKDTSINHSYIFEAQMQALSVFHEDGDIFLKVLA